jgi:hypothetical protein
MAQGLTLNGNAISPGKKRRIFQVVGTGDLVPANTSGGTATAGLVTSILIIAGSTAGSVVLRDGGGSGAIIATIPTPAAVGAFVWRFAGRGLAFETSLHATFSQATAAAVEVE